MYGVVKLDLLVLTAHPDDAEIGCGGTILKHATLGQKVGIVDLTRGELGTKGSAEVRDREAQAAAKFMGLTVRENLCFRDGFFKNDEAHQLKVLSIIRKYRPDVIITNAYHDRHPDHQRASELVETATFLAGLRKIETQFNGKTQEAWRPSLLLHLIQSRPIRPDIVIDISQFWEQKLQSIRAYQSQLFDPDLKDVVQAYIAAPDFIQTIEARAREFGKAIGVSYAEGFLSKKILGVTNLSQLR